MRPTWSELRPPYRDSRAPTSRPSWSAPRKYCAADAPHCGPIGMPPGLTLDLAVRPDGQPPCETTGIFLPFSLMKPPRSGRSAQVRDVAHVERREQAGEDDQEEDGQDGEADPVAAESAPREQPRALALDPRPPSSSAASSAAVSRVKSSLVSVVATCSLFPSLLATNRAAAVAAGPPRRITCYFRQYCAKSANKSVMTLQFGSIRREEVRQEAVQERSLARVLDHELLVELGPARSSSFDMRLVGRQVDSRSISLFTAGMSTFELLLLCVW